MTLITWHRHNTTPRPRLHQESSKMGEGAKLEAPRTRWHPHVRNIETFASLWGPREKVVEEKNKLRDREKLRGKHSKFQENRHEIWSNTNAWGTYTERGEDRGIIQEHVLARLKGCTQDIIIVTMIEEENNKRYNQKRIENNHMTKLLNNMVWQTKKTKRDAKTETSTFADTP